MTTTSYMSPSGGINRNRYPLGSNHAEMLLDMPCSRCNATFDVGWERAHTRAFRRLCFACAEKEITR